ncbi:MAG: hypothetical protein BGO26_16655 [Actinobacteria bacterium 69-20]|nr:hypothetical protein [Actinomycetota bacterium]OJV27103.1 MAG: hypothetical protein BGO26_16655 [Actinobacteria bacterium 69-20]
MGWESVDFDGTTSLFHARRIDGPASVEISQLVHSRGCVIEPGAVLIGLGDPRPDDMTADDARAFARQLLAAADELDVITAS